MRVLVVGGGGREHAIAWKLRQSPLVTELFVAPGNAGIALEAGIQCVELAPNDFNKILSFIKKTKIDFVMVGPEQPLSEGLVDYLHQEKILVLGPTKVAAQLESSKIFAKELMKNANIPTARFGNFTEVQAALEFVRSKPWEGGYVVKADGLCAGKGVVVCDNSREASIVIEDFLLRGQMGAAGKKIVVEEKLLGKEVSAFALCDGEHFISLGFACDYKQLQDGGKGPNTGGMGAYAPADWLPSGFFQEIASLVIQPLLQEMKNRAPFQGILFIGLMLTGAGPKVIEFNVRFGDPETQVILPRIGEDLLPWLVAAAKGKLSTMPKEITWKMESAVHVVMAAGGYPGWKGKTVRNGDRIQYEIFKENNTKVFFAAVKAGKKTGELVTAGGRVLGITALGENREQARAEAYKKIKMLSFSGMQMRTDIGL